MLQLPCDLQQEGECCQGAEGGRDGQDTAAITSAKWPPWSTPQCGLFLYSAQGHIHQPILTCATTHSGVGYHPKVVLAVRAAVFFDDIFTPN